jgi:hypothetical protein
VAFTAGYAALLIIGADLGPTDDHHLLNSLQIGLSWWPCVYPEMGRFSPLCLQELNLIARLSPTATAYFAFQALALIVVVWVFVTTLRNTGSAKYSVVAAVLLMLSAGFVTTWFRIMLVERDFTLFLALFVLCYVMFQRSNGWPGFIGALVAGNFAMYYKEPGFLFVGGLAATHLLLAWRSGTVRAKLLDGLLMASAALFLLTYWVVVFSHHERLYGSTAGTGISTVWLLGRNAASYLLSDPVILLLAVPLTAWRAWRVLIWRQPAHPVYDGLLAAACAYVSVFFVFNIYSPYYWLPVYVFAVPALLYFATQTREMRGVAWKAAAGLSFGLIALNVLPTGLHLISFYKYVPINYNAAVDFLRDDISRRAAPNPPAIHIEGIAPDTASIYYDSLNLFLQAAGLTPEQFRFASALPPESPQPLLKPAPGQALKRGDAEYSSYYTVVQRVPTAPLQPGDYLVVIPQTTRNVDAEYLRRIEQDCCDLVFRTHSPLAIPNLSLKTWLRMLAVKFAPLPPGAPPRGENFFGWPDYYVFKQRGGEPAQARP